MNEDRLLEEFARLARAEAAADTQVWERLAAGTLPAEEEERLRAAAAESPQARADYELFLPFGTQFRERVLAELRATRSRRSLVAAPVDDSKMISRPPTPRRRWWPHLLAAAAATVVIAIFWTRAPGDLTVQDLGALPEFRLEIDGAARQRSKGVAPATPTLVPGSTFRIVLRPATPVTGPLRADFYVARDGDWREWPVDVVVGSTGALIVEQRLVDDVTLPAGTWTLAVAVGRPAALPAREEVRRHFENAASVPAAGGWRLYTEMIQVVTVPLEVEFGGCAAVLGPLGQPTCVLGREHRIELWARSDPGVGLEVVAGDRQWELGDAESVDSGFLFRLDGLEADAVVVRAFEAGRENTWRLKLDRRRFDALDEARELVRTKRSAEARRLLEQRVDEAGSTLEAGMLRSTLARFLDPEQARGELREALRLHREATNISAEVDDLSFLHYLLFFQLEDLEEARRVLFSEIPRNVASLGDSAYLIAFYRAQWAIHTGHDRAALDELRAAIDYAEHLGRDREHHMARQLKAHQLRRLGHHAESTKLFAQLIDQIDQLPSACNRAKLYNNAAWDRLLALEARQPVLLPVAELQEAQRLVVRCPAQDHEERASLGLNLALTHYHAGELDSAQRQLDQVRQDALGPRLLVWHADLAGRLAAARGELETGLAHFASLEQLATTADWPAANWRASVGRARALAAAGRVDEALAELSRSESHLDAESLRAPIDAGRDTSIGAREWSTRWYLDLLVRLGREAEALELARRARSRLFRGLAREARHRGLSTAEDARWSSAVLRYNRLRSELEKAAAEDLFLPVTHQDAVEAEREAQRRDLGRIADEALGLLGTEALAGQEPATWRPGELLLVYHPAPDGWFAFAADAASVEVRRLGPLDPRSATPADLAAQLLEPFAERITGARRLKVLATGALRAVDFHALPFGGDVLVAAVPVTYGLDLPASTMPSSRRALLIEDPVGDLPRAPEEIAAVRRALKLAGDWQIEDANDLARVRELLPSVDLMHFAGHGDFAGHQLASGLLFDRDGSLRLSVGDILTSPGVPSTVVLSACVTARTAAHEAPVSLGVAHAFLLAGGQVAIGTVRPVEDRTSTALLRRLYSTWDAAPETAAEALAAAQLVERQRDPTADWAAFRILER